MEKTIKSTSEAGRRPGDNPTTTTAGRTPACAPAAEAAAAAQPGQVGGAILPHNNGPEDSNSAHVQNLDPHAPVGEKIDMAYSNSLVSAMDAVRWVIIGGTLLLDQKKVTPHGQWLKWLGENCKQVSANTAERMMRATAYVYENGTFDAQSIRQLYLEAGVIKDLEQAGSAGPPREKSILLPFQNTFEKLRLVFTDDWVAALKPVAVPQALGYVEDVQSELSALKGKLLKRMPAGQAGK